MRIGAHIATVAALFAAFLVLPAWQGGVNPSTIRAQSAFTDKSASPVSQDQAVGSQDVFASDQSAPVTTYTILINRSLHADAEELARWVGFLEGEDATPPQGPIACTICTFDDAGAALARDFAARLAPHQMTLHDDVGVLVLSKVEAGKFDLVVMSDEVAKAAGAYTAYDLPFVEVIHR